MKYLDENGLSHLWAKIKTKFGECVTKEELEGKGYLTEITEEIKSEIVQMVIESLGGNPVFGYVDKNNNIIVSGNLPDGEYTVMYEMEEGDPINIGNLVLDNTVEYSIEYNMPNCTSTNNATTIIEGESYSATITANSGYELKSVSVTMGGTAVTVTNGVISIPNVTGDIVITAEAEETTVAEPTNWITEVGYIENTRIRSSNGTEQALTGVETTNYIPVEYGDTVTIENIMVEVTGNNSMAVYNADKVFIAGSYLTKFMNGEASGNGTAINGERASQTITNDNFLTNVTETSGIAYLRFSANEITENSIVTVTKN